MELGDINDLPSERAKKAFVNFIEAGLYHDSSTCPFEEVAYRELYACCRQTCLKLFPKLDVYYECPCWRYGEEAIKAAQIMIDVYLGYKEVEP